MDNTTQPANEVRTLGFNHVNLVVADVERSVSFYRDGLGLAIEKVTPQITFMTTPGTGDSIALQLGGGPLDVASGKQRTPGNSGGVDHLGFDVAEEVLEVVVAAALAAGGKEMFRVAGAGGMPTVFVTDPDGYILQLTARRVPTP